MMIYNRKAACSLQIMIFACVLTLISLSSTGLAQDYETSVLIQKSPVEGGIVTPDTGVHNFSSGQRVTLTATPKPGYRFVYWLGDVFDPASSSTAVQIDSPKIIIAVFERSKYDSLIGLEHQEWSSNPRTISSYPITPSTGGGSGAKRPSKYRGPSQSTPQEQQVDDFPVPQEKEDQFPVPEEIPEPATILLLAVGSFMAARFRSQKNNKERYAILK